MKLFLIIMLLNTGGVYAQPDTSYQEILSSVPEITVDDSLKINTDSWNLYRLDSNYVKKWFRPLLGTTTNNRLKNRSYYLAGKITSKPVYDLLFLVEEKRKNDTVEIKVVHFVTIKKTGQYISDKEVAVSGIKKRSVYETSSVLFPDLQFKKFTTITAGETEYVENSKYQINNTGRFIVSINE